MRSCNMGLKRCQCRALRSMKMFLSAREELTDGTTGPSLEELKVCRSILRSALAATCDG